MGLKPRVSAPVVSSQRGADFDSIYQRAAFRKGGPSALESLLPSAKSRAQLRRVGDDRYLSAMARAIFRAGFVWKVVDNKWPGFEAAFQGFQIPAVASLDAQDLDTLSQDTRIIRNRTKIVAVRDNARFVFEVAAEHGSFGAYLASWPEDDLVGLWTDLHKRGSRLGGFTRAYFLRAVGKDVFLLTTDVVKALVSAGVVDKAPTSKADLHATQEAFNAWRLESGRSYCQLSRILACSVD